MPQAPPRRFVEFARHLLEHEAANAGTGYSPATGFEPVCRTLHERLSPLISSVGFEALMARAIKLPAREYPWLAKVTIVPNGHCTPTGLAAAISSRAPDEAAEGVSAVLAHFIWLLVIFLGEDLALRKVREAWPGVPIDMTHPSGVG